MEAIFYTVLGFTPWISTAILAIFVLKIFLKNKFSANMYRILFLALALRIAVPINLSLPKAPINISLPVSIQSTGADSPAVISQIATNSAPVLPLQAGFDLASILPMLYILGVIISLLCAIIPFVFYSHRLRTLSTRLYSGEIFNAVNNTVDVYLCPEVSSPTLCGLFRPRLYIGNNDYDKSMARYIVRHELCHKKRGDLWLKLLLVISQAIAFFNPLVYWMVREARRDIEKSCDEFVVKNSDIYKRAEYGDLLLKFYSAPSRSGVLTATFSSGKHIKSRFAAIVDTTVKKRGTPIIIGAIALILSASLLVSCSSQKTDKKQAAQSAAPSISTATKDKSEPKAPSSSPASSSSDASSSSEVRISSEVRAGNEEKAGNEKRASSEVSASAPKSSGSGNSSTSILPQNGEAEKNSTKFSPAIVDYSAKVTGFGNRGHRGIDFAASKGTDVFAAHDGVVTRSEFDSANGNIVVIENEDKVSTTYSHMDTLNVEKGAKVTAGDKVGTVGNTGNSTGNHLHFEISIGGELVNPADYLPV